MYSLFRMGLAGVKQTKVSSQISPPNVVVSVRFFGPLWRLCRLDLWALWPLSLWLFLWPWACGPSALQPFGRLPWLFGPLALGPLGLWPFWSFWPFGSLACSSLALGPWPWFLPSGLQLFGCLADPFALCLLAVWPFGPWSLALCPFGPVALPFSWGLDFALFAFRF